MIRSIKRKGLERSFRLDDHQGVIAMMRHRKPTHPGELFREDVIVPLGLTVTEAARRLGVGRTTLSAVANGKAALTPDLAIRIGRATRTTPESWLYTTARLAAGMGIPLDRSHLW